MQFLIAIYIITIGFFINHMPSFIDYYNNLTEPQKENLHTLGNKYPDEFFVLNMLIDR